ncbi:MAG TPA: glycosyl hydrolase family 2, partial [Terriglobales bacterium]
MKLTRLLLFFTLCATALTAQQMNLHEGWMIQTSAHVSADPGAISQPGFSTAGWYPATVPSTVFNALVENKVYPDPDYGMNLRQAAGVEYKIGANYSHEEIPRDSPYAAPWWFRTEFTLAPSFRGKTIWLDFHGINYRAAIWLNGHELASEEEAQGTFRRFEFDATQFAHTDATNVLAVEVFAPRIHDLAITFVDWNPMPPDKDMGLWGAVSVRGSGPVEIRSPFVETEVLRGGGARVRVTTTLVNASDVPRRGTLRGSLGTRSFAIPVALAAHASQTVERDLTLAHPRLWWPHDLGQPNLYPLRLRFAVAGKVSDSYQHEVGLDQITAEKTSGGAEQFLINGRKLFVR